MSKEQKPKTLKIVTLIACRDRDDDKVLYEAGTELEFDRERAEAAVAAGYAEPAKPRI